MATFWYLTFWAPMARAQVSQHRFFPDGADAPMFDAKMQLLDLPGIIEGAADGKGRGRQVIGVGKSADLILMVLDCQKGDA